MHSMLVGTYSYFILTLSRPPFVSLSYSLCAFAYSGVISCGYTLAFSFFLYISLVDCIDHWRMLGLDSPSNP